MDAGLIQRHGLDEITWQQNSNRWWHGTTPLGAMFTIKLSDRPGDPAWRLSTSLPRYHGDNWAGDSDEKLKAYATQVNRKWLTEAHHRVTFRNAINLQRLQRCFTDPAEAFLSAATERPFNNTDTCLSYCNCAEIPRPGQETPAVCWHCREPIIMTGRSWLHQDTRSATCSFNASYSAAPAVDTERRLGQ